MVGKSTTPGTWNDEPSTAVGKQFPTEAKDETKKDDKKKPAIEKDRPSQSTKTEETDQKGDGAIKTSTTYVTNLPSGLDVIANAAANVDVYDHSVEIIVIDDVPEVRAVSVSSIDASVYSFQGAKELYDPFEQTLNKTLSAK